jgi:hypothetical protein
MQSTQTNRVSDEQSNTSRCWENSSPQGIGVSTQRSHGPSSERLCVLLEDSDPGHQPRRRMTRLVGVVCTEPLFQNLGD